METYAKELLAPARKPKEFRQVWTKGIDDVWGIDLADMGEWHESNNGYKYIFVAVDAFSRFAWCVPMRRKTESESWDALATVMRRADTKPERVWVGQGTEFYNKIWTANLKKMKIERYSTFGQYKVAIAERFIRTLKERIWFEFVKNNNRKWVNILDEIVDDYNDTVNYTGLSPRQSRMPRNAGKIFRLYKRTKVGKPRYKLGQWVRISRVKGTFEKGFHPRWSYEIYKIVSIRLNEPVSYYLQDYYGEEIKGAFYESELQPVADKDFFPAEKVLKTRKNKGVVEKLVKLLGYDKPVWLPAEAVGALEEV